MSDQDDDSLPLVLWIMFGVIALAVSVAIGVGIYANDSSAPTAAVTAVAGDGYAEVAEIGEPLVKVYFAVGNATLPEGAAADLSKATSAFQAKPGQSVLLSGFHDESGSATANEEIAKNRAKAVKQALVAAGIPADHVLLKKPATALGGTDAAEARRVEVRVQ